MKILTHLFTLLAMALLISACASHSERKAPCSHDQRQGCGPLISDDSRYS